MSHSATRGPRKRADALLGFEPNLSLAVVEAKRPTEPLGGGMQQALAYAESVQVLASAVSWRSPW